TAKKTKIAKERYCIPCWPLLRSQLHNPRILAWACRRHDRRRHPGLRGTPKILTQGNAVGRQEPPRAGAGVTTTERTENAEKEGHREPHPRRGSCGNPRIHPWEKASAAQPRGFYEEQRTDPLVRRKDVLVRLGNAKL